MKSTLAFTWSIGRLAAERPAGFMFCFCFLFLFLIISVRSAFSALMLLVGQQEGHYRPMSFLLPNQQR